MVETRGVVGRALAVMIVVLGLAGGGVGEVAGRAQEAGTAGLTLHLRECPLDYAGEDFYGACHGRPMTGGYGVSAIGPDDTAAGTTDAGGDVTFDGLAPGTYQVYGGPPARGIEMRVFCAPASAPGTPFPFAPGDPATNSRMVITLGAGDEVICDWYFLPETTAGAAGLAADETATLTIHRRVCPADFFGPDFYGVCHDAPQTAGVELFLEGPAERIGRTDGAGDVVFAELPPGMYRVFDSDTGGDFTTLHVFCAPAASPGTPFPAGLSLVGLAAGDDVVCDWYYTNPDLSGSVAESWPTAVVPPPFGAGTTITIASWRCPPDLAGPDYAAACDTPGAGIRFLIGPRGSGGGDEIAGDDGVVRRDLAALPRGALGVTAFPPSEGTTFYGAVVACIGEDGEALQVMRVSSLSGGSAARIPVEPGDAVRCDWYHVPAG